MPSSGGYAPKFFDKSKKCQVSGRQNPNSLVHQLTEDEKKALTPHPEQKQKVTDEMKVLISKFLSIKEDKQQHPHKGRCRFGWFVLLQCEVIG